MKILYGMYDFTEGSTHYHNDMVYPYWADSLNEKSWMFSRSLLGSIFDGFGSDFGSKLGVEMESKST